MVNVLIETIGTIMSKVAFVLLIVSYVWMGYKTNIELIFYVLQLFNQISSTFGYTIPTNFSKVAQCYASLIRLNAVLHSEDMDHLEYKESEKPSISLNDVCFTIRSKNILNRISMKINNPGLTILTGPVGSGKSSLLKIVLKDYQAVIKGKEIRFLEEDSVV